MPPASSNLRYIAIAAACVAINIGLNKLSVILSLPVYMDTVGTILSAALLPAPVSILVATASSVVGSIVTHPVVIYFVGTQIVVSLTAIVAFRWNLFHRIVSAVVVGLVIGIASAIASAPIVVLVFGGVTVPGTTAIHAVLMAAGNDIWTSVLTGSIFISSIDKILTCIVVWVLFKRIPNRLLFNNK